MIKPTVQASVGQSVTDGPEGLQLDGHCRPLATSRVDDIVDDERHDACFRISFFSNRVMRRQRCHGSEAAKHVLPVEIINVPNITDVPISVTRFGEISPLW